MSSIDQQFIEFIVKSLVSHPDDVVVDRIIDEKGVLLSLTVHPEDLGRVIGKRGATAQSLRSLLRALGTKNDARYNLKIVDVDRPEGEREHPAPTQEQIDASKEEEVASDLSTDDSSVDEPTDEPVDNEEPESDRMAKTRKELADLDDLDI